MRNLDRGEEPVVDPAEASQLRLQARLIHLWAVVGAALFTAAAMLAPRLGR